MNFFSLEKVIFLPIKSFLIHTDVFMYLSDLTVCGVWLCVWCVRVYVCAGVCGLRGVLVCDVPTCMLGVLLCCARCDGVRGMILYVVWSCVLCDSVCGVVLRVCALCDYLCGVIVCMFCLCAQCDCVVCVIVCSVWLCVWRNCKRGGIVCPVWLCLSCVCPVIMPVVWLCALCDCAHCLIVCVAVIIPISDSVNHHRRIDKFTNESSLLPLHFPPGKIIP